jgi:hypothetical protein
VKHESRKNSKKNGRWNGFTEGGHWKNDDRSMRKASSDVGKSRWATTQKETFQTLRKNNNKWGCGFNLCHTKLVI